MGEGRLSSANQAKLIEHFVASTTARYAAELIVVNRKTAAYYFQDAFAPAFKDINHPGLSLLKF